MQKQSCGAVSLVTVAVVLMAVPHRASAYVDPGSGAMLWQVLAASVLGSLFYVRKAAGAIRRKFTQIERSNQVVTPNTVRQ